MKLLARIGAVASVALALIGTAITMRDKPKAATEEARPVMPAADDPLLAELVRCQSIGQAGADDPACLRAWAENRRRFLAPGARPEARLSDLSSQGR